MHSHDKHGVMFASHLGVFVSAHEGGQWDYVTPCWAYLDDKSTPLTSANRQSRQLDSWNLTLQLPA
jgi:hypothetical protein